MGASEKHAATFHPNVCTVCGDPTIPGLVRCDLAMAELDDEHEIRAYD